MQRAGLAAATTRSVLAWAVAAVAVATALTGCNRGENFGPPEATYTTRGRVESVPIAGQPQTEFIVHHEAIPTFKGFDGRLGMPQMVMPLPLEDGVSLAEIAIGDEVELDLGVWTHPRKRVAVTRIVKLPAQTRLEFDPIAP